jgi:hypothetical protein
VETLPGLDHAERVGRLLVENRRLQRERDEALSLIPEEAPPPTRRQRLVRLGLTAAEVSLLGSFIAVVLPLIEKRWPFYASLVRWAAEAVGLQ